MKPGFPSSSRVVVIVGKQCMCPKLPVIALFWVLPVVLVSTLPAPAQDFSKVQVEKVASGFRFTEGPVWSRQGFLLFSDVPANRIYKFVPGQGVSVFRENSNGANGNTFDAKGRFYSCESRTRRVVRMNADGTIEVIADSYQGKRFNAPNDIVVRRDGHIYFTDPAFGRQQEGKELNFYGVYHVAPDGQLELIARPEGRPNGIALSPDGRILYVANSDERVVYAYDLDKNGRASNERIIIRNINGVPDGIKVDEKGNIYVTCQNLAVYRPDGQLIAEIPIPETPANCAFGDPDFKTLYVTARTSIYRIRLDVRGAIHY